MTDLNAIAAEELEQALARDEDVSAASIGTQDALVAPSTPKSRDEGEDLGDPIVAVVKRAVDEGMDITRAELPDNVLEVPPIRQTTGFCGPAALASLLGFFGVQTTENEVAEKAGATHTEGVSGEQVAKAAKAFGMEAAYKLDGNAADIRRWVGQERVPLLVFWFGHGHRGDGGHASLVVGFDEENVFMMDPEAGMVVPKAWEKFLASWFTFDGGVPSKDQLRVGEYVAIKPV